MINSKLSSHWLVIILLLIIFGLALYLRIVPIYDSVFVGDNVKFITNDAYYFVRQVDNLVQHFPHYSSFDPYLNYPTGLPLGPMNFFVYLLGGITWLLGMGSPSTHMLDIVSAYLPAFLGALTVIPVYFIGKALFNRKVGIVAAALIAILPGEFLGRTLLGVADRDSLEILLTTLIMLFLILAVKSARDKQLTFRRLNPQHLSAFTKPIIYSLLSGILLGLSILTWRGSFLFVIVFLAFFVIQSIIHYAKNESFAYISFVGIVTFLVALLIVGSISRSQLWSAALAISLFIPFALSGLSWLLRRWKAKPFSYFMAIVGIGLVGIGILYGANPSLFKSILDQFSVFIPTGTSATITEMGSILFPTDHFTLDVIWNNYTTGLFLSIIALGILIYLSFKQNNSKHMFILVWSLITLIATLVLRRIAPFFAITVALLTGYLVIILYYAFRFTINHVTRKSNSYISSRLLEFIGLKAPTTVTPLVEVSPQLDYYETLGVPRNATHKQIKKAHVKLVYKYSTSSELTDEGRERLRQIDRAYSILSDNQKRAAYDHSEYDVAAQGKDKARIPKRGGFQVASVINMGVAGLAIFFLVFFPNFKPITITINQTASLAPSDAWCNSLAWFKDNSPEPFGDATFYYGLYQTSFNYPETAYGIAAWWDYGYWILRIGHRLPNCDPGAGARESVARLFLSQSEASADEIIEQLNSKYIILDYDTIIGKVSDIAIYAGDTGSENYFDIYYQPKETKLVPVLLFYPEYYRSISTRLYNFDGAEVIPQESKVISYEQKISSDGKPYKEITSAESFSTYEAAIAFVSSQRSGNYKIVSEDPIISPIPLEALKHYKLIHSISSTKMPSFYVYSSLTNSVKIFEYIP